MAEDLYITPAIIHLKSKEILEDIDEEKITAKITEKEKVTEFVKIIKKRGKRAFPACRDYLENCPGSENLAEEMDVNLKIVEAELAGLTLEKDDRRRTEKWKEFEEKFHYVRCQCERNVLLIGKTGSGKSATENTIFGKDHFKASGTSASVTKTIDMKDFQEDRFNITVIDTPGLFDTAKDFRNEDMFLPEIAKTMINFKEGIHFFLLVFSSTRFTAEEQQTVAVIEKILSKNVYKNCVVVLTYAQVQYGAKGKYSLREHITNEVQRGGNSAELIKQVKNRVVAVENFFGEDFLKEKHRQALLWYLAQARHDNRGSVYSNKSLEYARVTVEKQDEQRKQRNQREAELTKMRSQVHNYLVQKYLNDLTVKQLDNIYGHFKTDVLFIMARSFVNQLPCITKEDVKECLKDFVWENDVLIAKLKDMKIQEEKKRNEYQRRRQQLKEKENVNKMQHIVLPLILYHGHGVLESLFLGLMGIFHLQITDIMNTSFLGLTVVVMMISHLQIHVAATFCEDNVILRVGHRGVVSCDFGEFDVVGWLNPTKDLETTLPFISLEGSVIHQQESGNEEYSMLPNGSLVIKNVTYSHEKNYTARVVKNGAVFHDEVPVKVYVLPVPAYPVVNGRADQDRVVILSSNGEASFDCTMDNIRPAVSLEVVSISSMSNGTSMTAIPSTLTNPDGTYNVSLDTQLRIGITQPIGIYFLQCRVAGKFVHLFPSVATIDLVHGEQHIIKFPSVNGSDNQQHIVLDVNRTGTLTCSIDSVPPNGYLEWNYSNRDSSTRVALERQRHYSLDNGDGTYNITSITSYRAISESVQSVTFKCGLSGKAAQLYPLYTTVELHFPPVDSDSSSNTSHSKQLLRRSVVLIFAVLVLAATVICAIYFIFKTRELTKKYRALKAIQDEDLLRRTLNCAPESQFQEVAT